MPNCIFAYHSNGRTPRMPEEGGDPNLIMGSAEVTADNFDANC